MDEKNEVLAAVNALATRMDEQFGKVNEQFGKIDEQFGKVDERFVKIDEQFVTLRRQLAEQLDGLSDSVHAEIRRSEARMRDEVNLLGAKVEGLDSKIALVGENVGNVIRQLSRYNTEVELPLEHRVSALEVRVTRLEKKKPRN